MTSISRTSSLSKEGIDQLTAFRKERHALPELSGYEYATSEAVQKFLKKLGVEQVISLGGTGVAAVFEADAEGPTTLLRCELDALPIQEINDFSHRSHTEGVSHKCGHDGHLTMMCGVAMRLVEQPIRKGKAVLLFQPAEENGMGAKAVLYDHGFTYIKPDRVFALHNLPAFPKHQIVFKKGTFTPAVKSIIIHLKGKTSHAAEPECGHNPALAVAELLQTTNKLSVVDTDREDFQLVTVIHVTLGEKAYGISAGEAEVHLTLRAWDNETMESLAQKVETCAYQITDKHQLGIDISCLQEFAANINDEEAVDAIVAAAKANEFYYQQKPVPFKWGEDFGIFTEKYPGAMFGLGAGEDTPALHNPDYDFPDEIIPTGVAMFEAILRQYHS